MITIDIKKTAESRERVSVVSMGKVYGTGEVLSITNL
jgi:hypothetical protein